MVKLSLHDLNPLHHGILNIFVMEYTVCDIA